MSKEYVEQQDGAYRVAGTRVSLDSVVYAFRRGASPESIQRSYPPLSLEQIYGAIDAGPKWTFRPRTRHD